MLPGNQRGLLGSAAAADTVKDRVPAAGAVNFFRLSLFPPRKEALVAPTTDPVF